MDAESTPDLSAAASLTLAADLTASGQDDRVLSRACERGALERISPGAYVPREEWDSLDPRRRQLLRALAVQGTRRRTGLVLSHESAALVWGLPTWGWPRGPSEFVVPPGSAARSTSRVRIRSAPTEADQVLDVEGRAVTSFVRTVADLLYTRPRDQGVVLVDHLLRERRMERDELIELAASRPAARNRRRAAWVAAFGDEGGASPGESVSRLVAHDAGFVAPVLQKEFRDRAGLIGYADFFFPDPDDPERGTIGEFDGDVKYLSAVHRHGRSPEEVVRDEKRREDRLRALPTTNGLARWSSDDLRRPGGLAVILRRARAATRPRLSRKGT
jgi:hypothetical protein